MSSNSSQSSPNSASPTATDAPETTASAPKTATHAATDPSSLSKAQEALESLSLILPDPLPSSCTSANNPAATLLYDATISTQIVTLLRHPASGGGDNPLCRWLYDTFQSSDPALQLVVLRFLPLVSGLYLSRSVTHQRRHHRHPLAGFEAVLLALYAHVTTSRDNQAVSVTIPDISNPSIYHETSNTNSKNMATDLNIAVISPSLEPHGTVRSTRRARIVGVALELYYAKISLLPHESKLEFCEFIQIWAGNEETKKIAPKERDPGGDDVEEREGRVPLPWELLHPCLRVLGHCLMGGVRNKEVYEKAYKACECLHKRAMHDINAKAILATGSLLNLVKMQEEEGEVDHTEIQHSRVISL